MTDPLAHISRSQSGWVCLPIKLNPILSRLTPHRWAYDAFADIQRHDGTLADILPQLGVLAAMALGLLALGSFLLQRSLSRAL